MTALSPHAQSRVHAQGGDLPPVTPLPERPGRKPTVDEAEAILTLVRGGWLRLELTLDD